MSIRAIIVDDEQIARARLRRLLSEEPDVEIVGEFAYGTSAVGGITELRPDVAFVDVRMPGGDGFHAVRSMPENDRPLIVFATAFSEHAARAFDVAAFDYLLKPFDAARVRRTLQRVRARATAAPRYRQRLLTRAAGRVRSVATREVDYLESAANYVRVHTGAQTYLLREPIGSLASELDPSRFARIHRRTIVNLSRVHDVEAWMSGDAIVTLKDGRTLRMSRTYRAAFHRALGGK